MVERRESGRGQPRQLEEDRPDFLRQRTRHHAGPDNRGENSGERKVMVIETRVLARVELLKWEALVQPTAQCGDRARAQTSSARPVPAAGGAQLARRGPGLDAAPVRGQGGVQAGAVEGLGAPEQRLGRGREISPEPAWSRSSGKKGSGEVGEPLPAESHGGGTAPAARARSAGQHGQKAGQAEAARCRIYPRYRS